MLTKPLFLTFFGSHKRLLALSLCALSLGGVSCQSTGLPNTGPAGNVLQPSIPYMSPPRSGSGGHLRVAALVAPELVPALCAPQDVRPASSNAEIDREYRDYLEKALALRQQQLDLTRSYQQDTSRELSDQRREEPSSGPTSAPSSAPTAEPTSAPTYAPSVEPTSAPTYAPSAAPTSAPSAAPSLMPSAEPIAEPTATPTPSPTPIPTPLPEPSQLRDFFYFSYDDSASTAAVELVKNQLNQGELPNTSLARPWEFLNQIHFPYNHQEEIGLFKVSMGIDRIEDPENPLLDSYDLGVHITAPALCRQARPPMVLTLVIDVSGSMDENGTGGYGRGSQERKKISLVQTGLNRLKQELVPGDVVNLVTFSNTAKSKAENLQMPEAMPSLVSQIDNLRTEGGTNLNAGLQEGYRIARKYYQPDKTNRVLMLTDAYANQGEIDPLMVSRQTQINDKAGIYFSGLGFGYDFNEAFLNQLTEVGKGAYYSIVNEEDAKRAFGERFLALTHAAARNVRFKLDYPAWLKHGESAAEEISMVAEGVQPTHFSFNTSQFFLERFRANKNPNKGSDTLRLEISYTLPSTGEKRTEVYEKPLSELIGKDQASIHNARLITSLTGLIQGSVSPERVRKEIGNLKN